MCPKLPCFLTPEIIDYRIQKNTLLITECLLSLVASYEAGNTARYSVALPSIWSVWCTRRNWRKLSVILISSVPTGERASFIFYPFLSYLTSYVPKYW